MSNLKLFLKALQRSGYPNSKTNVTTIAKAADYDLDFFLTDLLKELGSKKTKEFVNKTFSSLGANSHGIEIDLSDRVGETGSYIYLIINGFDFAEGDGEFEEVWIHYTWGPNELIHDGESKTLEDIYDDVDLGTMGEYDDLMDDIQYECISQIFKKTGLIIHFDSQI
jgi:hypothetical protein